MEHTLKMRSKEIKFRDPVVERVVDKFVSRSDVGFDKYGTTLQDERTRWRSTKPISLRFN